MIWNTIPNEERLLLWKKLREDIKPLLLEDQLKEVAKFFATTPFGARTIDYYSPKEWPTPWEILFYGQFCTSSISVLIFYTLQLVRGEKVLELFLVEDQEGIYLLPVVNNQFVLNYHLGEVSMYSEIKNNFKVLKTYKQEEIRSIT